MNAMWKSWSLSPKAAQARLDNAMKIVGEIDVPAKITGDDPGRFAINFHVNKKTG